MNLKFFFALLEVLPQLLGSLQQVVQTIERPDMAEHDAHTPIDRAINDLAALKETVEPPRTNPTVA